MNIVSDTKVGICEPISDKESKQPLAEGNSKPALVTLEQLEALDLLVWLRSGSAAAAASCCDESSITRRVRSVMHTVGLQLKRANEVVLSGELDLLRLQRVVHQHARYRGARPLRLEATHYIRQQLNSPSLAGWMLGPCHHRGVGTLLSLLQERVIDAWITSDLHDLPEGPEFSVIKLWEWPGELVVHGAHPLAHVRRPSRGDLERFPSLVLPGQLYPKLAQMVHARGFGRNCQLERYDLGSWDGLTHDAVTIVYGSCLSLAADRSLKRLHWDLGLTGGEALVLLREWQDAPAIDLLLEDLRRRQIKLQQQLPELVGQL